jgi:heterodisulfide reductase subunit C1
MGKLFDKLMTDVHLQEGLNACINCGTCTAICAAAEFYNYDPRIVTDTVQSKDDEKIEELLKSDTIWYCGECMSCKTRCPRGNTPGLIIMALRALSQELGHFVESEKGRQQLYLKRVIGGWILNHGYCLYLEGVGTDGHPEQGPVWDWIQENWSDVMKRVGANYKGNGPGVLRKIPEEALNEIREIFKVTGGTQRFEKIEHFSKKKAEEMGLLLDEGTENEYMKHIFSANNNKHNSHESER